LRSEHKVYIKETVNYRDNRVGVGFVKPSQFIPRSCGKTVARCNNLRFYFRQRFLQIFFRANDSLQRDFHISLRVAAAFSLLVQSRRGKRHSDWRYQRVGETLL
jgi:hypothetical protein